MADGLGGGGALLICTQALAIQLREVTENLSQDSQTVLDTNRYVNLITLLGVASSGILNISYPRLAVDDFRYSLVVTSVFQVAELKDFWHQLTFSPTVLLAWTFGAIFLKCTAVAFETSIAIFQS